MAAHVARMVQVGLRASDGIVRRGSARLNVHRSALDHRAAGSNLIDHQATAHPAADRTTGRSRGRLIDRSPKNGLRSGMSSHPEHWVIAIDGPAGAGKTTVGQGVAARLDALDFDTGVLYRVVTYRALTEHVAVDDEQALAAIARDLMLTTNYAGDGRVRLVVAGVADPQQLRSPEVDRNLSVVAAYPAVRAALVEKQREIARMGRVILLGRDIGTVIVPEATLKIYLDASLTERAQRRYIELRQRGLDVSYEQVLVDMEQRDRLDSEREASPLRPAEDALVINTNGVPVDEVVRRIVQLARERIPALAQHEV
jgi:cytidylate kinase